jgi:hypothetical protein
MNTSTIVQKLWNYCNVLRDDGMSYGDYVEQLTNLLFLKMADEPACTYRCAGKRTRQLLCCTRKYECRVRAGARSGLRCPRPLLPARLSALAPGGALPPTSLWSYLLHPCSRTFRHPWRSQAPYIQRSLPARSAQLNSMPEKYSWPSLAPTLTVPTRAYMDRVRPFGGEKVHWTFSYFRLTPRTRGRGIVLESLGLLARRAQASSQKGLQ